MIAEVKNQGTNDLRVSEELPRQAKGNAIERLGKNLIGLRTALMRESIFPLLSASVAAATSSRAPHILDRVSTMAMFGKLNTTHVHNEEGGTFNRGSFYFRETKWSVEEMAKAMIDIAERSVLYYFLQVPRGALQAFVARGVNDKPYGNGVLLWFETDDFDAALVRADALDAAVVMPRHRNPPDGNGGPNHWECWLRDPDGYIVVLASPDGSAGKPE